MKRWMLALALWAPLAHAETLSGEQAFIACSGCHGLTEEDVDGIGPPLAGLRDREAGSHEGRAHSQALVASGITWNETTLKAFILAPEGMVPGTWMLYRNTLQPEEVDRLVAYILRH